MSTCTQSSNLRWTVSRDGHSSMRVQGIPEGEPYAAGAPGVRLDEGAVPEVPRRWPGRGVAGVTGAKPVSEEDRVHVGDRGTVRRGDLPERGVELLDDGHRVGPAR